MNKVDKLLRDLREEQSVLTSIKNYGLNPSLVKTLIVFYEFKIEAVKVAQKFGIHKSLVEKYYNQFGMMTESDFNRIFRFYNKSSIIGSKEKKI